MTAVEFLIEQICGEHTDAWKEEIIQAKEMEKEQIMEAYMKAKLEHISPLGFNIIKNKICMQTEKYYNETYKKP